MFGSRLFVFHDAIFLSVRVIDLWPLARAFLWIYLLLCYILLLCLLSLSLLL